MALAILDGTGASIDINVTPPGGMATSIKCLFGRWTARIDRQFFQAITFCSGGWAVPIPGIKSFAFTLIGFMTTGNAMSDPLVMFGTQAGWAFVLTAFTGCTFTGTAHAASDVEDIVAALSSGRSFDAISTGAVTTAWVVS